MTTTMPPSIAEIDAWFDANVLCYLGNCFQDLNAVQWGSESHRMWVIAHTRFDDVKVFWPATVDPTQSIDIRTTVEGYRQMYGPDSVRIRVYDGLATMPSQPSAPSVALSSTEQDYYNTPSNWAVIP